MPGAETQTLIRAAAILDSFTVERPELGVRDLARRLGLSPATAGRLLATLHSAGILRQNEATRAYALGVKVLSWASVFSSTLDVRSKARPVLEQLHRQTRESVSLYIRDGVERVCVERIESLQQIRVVVRVGERMQLYAGASGKVLLAFLPREQRKKLLAELDLVRLTENTLCDRKRLERDLLEILERGYAISLGERVSGAASVAAPIFDVSGSVVASLNQRRKGGGVCAPGGARRPGSVPADGIPEDWVTGGGATKHGPKGNNLPPTSGSAMIRSAGMISASTQRTDGLQRRYTGARAAIALPQATGGGEMRPIGAARVMVP
jgi:IclR family KDG regulon transcriptional repressor